MRSYSVGGRTVATAATANLAAAVLWNPSTSKPLFVNAIAWAKTVGTVDNLGLARTSTRGTAGSTVTPVAQNDYDNDGAPGTGALLDINVFSVAPTVVSTAALMFRWNLPATIGAGFILPLADLEVAPGTGLVLLTPVAVILQPADVSFFWKE